MIRKIALAIITIFVAISSASAVEMPEGHAKKTKALAENFIKHSRKGDYNKIYTSLRKILHIWMENWHVTVITLTVYLDKCPIPH